MQGCPSAFLDFFGIFESVTNSVSEGPPPWHGWLVEMSSPPHRIHDPTDVGICFRSRLSESDYGHKGKTRNICFRSKQIGFGKNVRPWPFLIWRVTRKKPALLLLKDCIIKDFKLSLRLPEARPGFLLGWNWNIDAQAAKRYHDTAISRASERSDLQTGTVAETRRSLASFGASGITHPTTERSIRHWTRPTFCTSPTSIATGSKKRN